MIFFDYIFYRLYIYYERYNYAPMYNSVVYLTVIIGGLTCCIWQSLLDILPPDTSKRSFIAAITIFLLIYYRYKNRIEILKRKFKCSKYNKSIPDWIMVWGTLAFSFIIGIIEIACMNGGLSIII